VAGTVVRRNVPAPIDLPGATFNVPPHGHAPIRRMQTVNFGRAYTRRRPRWPVTGGEKEAIRQIRLLTVRFRRVVSATDTRRL
jgi:hypothetical protein